MNTLIINNPRSVNETLNSNANDTQTESLQKLTPSYFVGKCVEIKGKRADWSELYQEDSLLNTTLPQEMLTHILKYVDAQSLGTLSQVSKFWNTQAHAARNCKVLDISRKNEDNLEATLVLAGRIVKSLKNSECSLEEINASNLSKHYARREFIEDWYSILFYMPKCLENLKVLNLEGFDICRVNFSDNKAFMSASKSLISLNLNSSDLYDTQLETVVNHYIELEDLSIGNCANLRLEDSYYDSHQQEYVYIIRGISNLLNLVKLVRLDLSGTKEITFRSIQVLSELKTLKILILKNCEAISDKCIKILNTFESLKYVDLRGTRVTKGGLKALNPSIQVSCDLITNQ